MKNKYLIAIMIALLAWFIGASVVEADDDLTLESLAATVVGLVERVAAIEAALEPADSPESFMEVETSLTDLATILAKWNESDNVDLYLALVEEFSNCVLEDVDYSGVDYVVSDAELVAMTIWLSGLMGTIAQFEFSFSDMSESGEEESEETSGFDYLVGAIEVCYQSEEGE